MTPKEALKGIKQAIAEYLHKQTGVSVEKHFEYLQYDTEISIVEQALTPPTPDEVCNALSEYFKLRTYEYDIVQKKFKRVFSKNEYYYIVNFDINGNIKLFEVLPPHLITMIGKFYESLEGEKC